MVGSAGGGVWTSDDGGTTWTPRTDSQPDIAIGALAIDPNAPDHIVVGTGEANQCGDCFSGDGILNSTDGGATWAPQDPGSVFDGIHIAQIAIDPTNSLREFAGTDAGLFETTDGGASWALPTGASYANIAGFISGVVVDSTGTVRVASPYGTWIVAQSADHGVTFTETDTGIAHPSAVSLVALAVAPGTPSTIYVSVGQDGQGVAVWKNTTGGSGTWTHLTAAPDFTGQAYSFGSGSANQGSYDNVLAVDPTNANHVIAGGIATVETTNGGTTWTNVNGQTFRGANPNKFHPDAHALAIRADHKSLMGNDGGVYLYDPAGPTVTNLQGNLNITQLYFGFNSVGGKVLAGAQDNASALYTGSTAWTGIFSGDGGPSYITPNAPAVKLIEANSNLYVTTDGFATTLAKITPLTSGQNFTPPMVAVPNTGTPTQPTVYFGGGEGLWRTTNPTSGSPTWTNLTPGEAHGPVAAIAVAPSNSNYNYVGFNDGAILLSTDGGTSFNPLPSQPFLGTANYVTGLSVNPAVPTELTASFTDGGATRYQASFPHIAQYGGSSWTNITGSGLPNQAVSRVVYDAGNLLAATDSGVFGSSDGGATWSPLGTGLPNVQVQDLDVEPDGVYAVTHGRGAWKLAVPIGDQTVSFTSSAPGAAKVGGSTYTPSASATSGLTATITVDGSASAVCSISGGVVSFTGVGTCVLDANQAGDGVNYNPAPQVQQSFAVGKTNQTITFAALANRTMLQPPFTVSATASSGLPVSFSTTTPSVCTSSGTNGQTISLVAAGTCTVQADQVGDGTYAVAPSVSRSFTVSKVSQTITFGFLSNRTMVQPPFTVSATASSGLPVSFSTTTPSVCTSSGTNGATITLVTGGTCTVTAAQAGTAVYNPAASVSRSFTVSKVSQTITFGTLANQTIAQPPFTVSATASSGLTVSFSTTTPLVCTAGGTNGATITLVKTGTCTVKATQTGNATYNAAASVSRSFTVSKVSQTITFGTLANQTIAQPPFTVSATASSGLAVSFSSTTPLVCTAGGANGATITLVKTGTCTVKATQTGNATYNAAASVSRSFTVSKVSQTITFDALANASRVQSPVTVSATASSGLTVSFSSTTTLVCTAGGANGATITLLRTGTCTVKATQTGNATYNAAPNVSRSFTVS